MGYQEAPNHIVWLNEQDRIASFHHVEGYYIQTFKHCHVDNVIGSHKLVSAGGKA